MEKSDTNFKKNNKIIFSWPIPPNRISATFHDPNYPFRYIREHSGIDISTPQGTPIHAPTSGYVKRVPKNNSGYTYLMIKHNEKISTIYGHISGFTVTENEYVSQGQLIGYTGGTPGTWGAGKLTTGPHLHFEVRAYGIPVNPLDYLPPPPTTEK